MSERELKSITFEDLGITYVIPSSGSSSGDVPKVVEEHINSKNNPHGVTAAQVGAAPAGLVTGYYIATDNAKLDEALETAYANTASPGIGVTKIVTNECPGFNNAEWIFTISRVNSNYGFIEGVSYTNSGTIKQRAKVAGAWTNWRDATPTSFAPASHSHAASTISGGTFAGPVYASNTAQAPITSQLRNSRVVPSEMTINNNGEICWIYE